jgi:hypothetical protein
MSGSSGFLLSGTRVHKKTGKPPSRNAAARESADFVAAAAPAKKRRVEEKAGDEAGAEA